jgi:hypothetical protein
MSETDRQKVIGAIVIGCALVGAAYTFSHFGTKTQLPAQVSNSAAPVRNAIEVKDSDKDGVEDWRDAFVQAKPIMIDASATSTYTLPSTLTGKFSIEFLKNYVNAKNAGSFGKSNEELVNLSAQDLADQTKDHLYGMKEVSVMETWTDEDIKLYANTMGGILLSSKTPPHENELNILKDIVTTGDSTQIPTLKSIEVDYKMYLDETLKVPVPSIFVKQHLDLINSYNALRVDLNAMTLVFDDPLVSLLRVKRYQDDALALSLSLQNMNAALQPYGHLFGKDDPALVFTNFDPSNQKQ